MSAPAPPVCTRQRTRSCQARPAFLQFITPGPRRRVGSRCHGKGRTCWVLLPPGPSPGRSGDGRHGRGTPATRGATGDMTSPAAAASGQLGRGNAAALPRSPLLTSPPPWPGSFTRRELPLRARRGSGPRRAPGKGLCQRSCGAGRALLSWELPAGTSPGEVCGHSTAPSGPFPAVLGAWVRG